MILSSPSTALDNSFVVGCFIRSDLVDALSMELCASLIFG